MKLKVKTLDDDGTITAETELSKAEASYLIQYAISSLMVQGVLFNMTEPLKSEEDFRIDLPKGSSTVQ